MTITITTINKTAEDFNVYFTKSFLQAWLGKKSSKQKKDIGIETLQAYLLKRLQVPQDRLQIKLALHYSAQ